MCAAALKTTPVTTVLTPPRSSLRSELTGEVEEGPLPLVTETMEGLYFEVKPRKNEAPGPRSSSKPRPTLTPNHLSCPSLPHLTSSAHRGAREELKVEEEEVEEEVRYKLTLIGSLPVHHLTTMPMLPWVVAEISRSQPAEKEPGAAVRCGVPLNPGTRNKTVFLCVSASWVRCVSVLGEGVVWSPLTHTVLFKCRPHQVTKLIHNSQEPCSFACLVRDTPECACYVFRCRDSTKNRSSRFTVPTIKVTKILIASMKNLIRRASSDFRESSSRYNMSHQEGLTHLGERNEDNMKTTESGEQKTRGKTEFPGKQRSRSDGTNHQEARKRANCPRTLDSLD